MSLQKIVTLEIYTDSVFVIVETAHDKFESEACDSVAEALAFAEVTA